MIFPLKNYKHKLPTCKDDGGFGHFRKYDVHTGVDLYCEEKEPVFAIEDGKIVTVEKFTGEWAGSPWWNNTSAILIEGESGVILYGEIDIEVSMFNTENVKSGDIVGYVKRVLKEDKGRVPSTSMLHLELHKHGTIESCWWKLNEPQPESLLDVTQILKQFFKDEENN